MTDNELKVLKDDIHSIKNMLAKVVNSMVEAESEIPEKMRRFVMYMHDMHDVKNLYDEHGQAVPSWVLREVERCDDRLRQLLQELHTDGGAFEKVRREMAKDVDNRWDHSRAITGPRKESP
jgi:tRNA G18 (ribose-2'-O)-methylase SpoU